MGCCTLDSGRLDHGKYGASVARHRKKAEGLDDMVMSALTEKSMAEHEDGDFRPSSIQADK